MNSRAKKWRRLDSGERSFAHQARPAVILASIARYRFARSYCAGKSVLDIGCGSGIGLSEMAPEARRIIGLDYSAETCFFARGSVGNPAVGIVAGEAPDLPFASHVFEVITAFEIIEHLERPASFLKEVARVLLPGGTFLLSTPNRPVYSPRGTWLDYHVREYDVGELRELLAPLFSSLEIFGQAHLTKDAQLDFNPLNRFIYPIKRRLDPRGVVLNKLRAAYVYLRWGESPEGCSPDRFPVLSEGVESLPILLAVCKPGG